MTEPKKIDCPYTDWNLSGSVGLNYPKIRAVDNRYIISTTNQGRCRLIDLEERSFKWLPSFGNLPESNPFRNHLAQIIRSLSVVTADGETTYAISGEYAAGAFATLTEDKMTNVIPRHGGAVSTIELDPSGRFAALGTGYYSLAPEVAPQAFIELWQIKEKVVCKLPTATLGCAVNNICWEPSGDAFIATVENLDQKSGYLLHVNAEHLSLHGIVPVKMGLGFEVHLFDYENSVLLAAKHEIEVRKLRDLNRVDWKYRFESPTPNDRDPSDWICTVAVPRESDYAIFNNGFLLKANGDHELFQLPRLRACFGVAMLPNGDCVGINEYGEVRIWHQPGALLPG